MVTDNILTWNDVKDFAGQVIETNHENKSSVNSSMNRYVRADRSLWVNRNVCEAITAKYASEQRLKLFKDKEKAVTHWFSNGKTVCLKVRRNVYNKNGNFTFSTDDLNSDYIVIYSYDGLTKIGHWFICKTKHVQHLTLKYNTNGGYWICNENNIISNAEHSIIINFSKNEIF